MATASVSPLHIYDGDIIQFQCETGYVYGELNRPSTFDLELEIISKEKIKVADFATFSISLKKELTSSEDKEEPEKITYGSVVYLKHQASAKFLTANTGNEVKLSSSADAKSSFRVVSPNHELAWGEELKDNYSIKLELFSGDNSLVSFDYDYQRKSYKPTLKANGTVFNVKLYCRHECGKQNLKSIKGGSVIILATLLNFEAYMFGNFDSSKIEEQSEDFDGRGLEEPTPVHESTQKKLGKQHKKKKKRPKEDFEIGLIKFMEGTFKTLPQQGDTLFQLERVSEGPPGAPIFFGEKCRIKHLFSCKYISVTREGKFILCDVNEKNEADLLFQISPASNSPGYKEKICDSHKVVFLHSKTSMYLSVNVKPHSDELGILYSLTLDKDSSLLQSQFEVLLVDSVAQGVMSPLWDSYYAIGITLFLQESFEKLTGDETLTVVIEGVKQKLEELETQTVRFRLTVMLKILNFVEIMEKVKKVMPKDSIKEVDQILRKDNKKKWWTIDLHVQKIMYEKLLEWSDAKKQPETEELTGPAPLKELIEKLEKLKIGAKEVLLKSDTVEGSIKKIIEYLEKYFNDDVTVDMENGFVFDIKEDEVRSLLLLLHLLFTKYIYIKKYQVCQPEPVATDETKAPAESKNETELTKIDVFEKLFGNDSQNFCSILFQLIENKDSSISYMSASLLFDIYMKEQIIESKDDIYSLFGKEHVYHEGMWKCSTMTDKNLLLEKMLTKQLDALSQNCSRFLNDISNLCVNDVYNETPFKPFQREAHCSGLFHIALEYCVQHKVYTSYVREEILFGCFKLLQRIAACNGKVQNELFNHFYEFLRFKKVTNNMILLVNEIFYDNPYLCHKLTEADLGKIFSTAIIIGNHQWTIVLQTIIEYSNQAVVQEYIAQLILENYTDILGHVLNLKETKEHERVSEANWLKILRCDKLTNECHLLLNIIDLLASCASRQCQFARSVAMKLFVFDVLVNIVSSTEIPSHRKIPFLRILTWTHLDGKNSTLELHMTSTIEKLFKERKPISKDATRKSSHIIYKEEESSPPHVMDLFYITYGVIPFLSQFCLQLRTGNYCPVAKLQSIRKCLLEFNAKWECVSEQLSRSECIQNIDSLLTKKNPYVVLDPPCPFSRSSTKCKTKGETEPVQPIEPNYKDIVELIKTNQKMKHPILHNILSMLKSLVILQKSKRLPCLKRINLEQMILRTLKLLKTLVQQMKEGTASWGELHDDDQETKVLKLVKIILYLDINITNDCKAKEHNATLFDLLQHQNSEIIVAILKVLQCLTNDEVAVQDVIIKSCKDHNCILIEKVHQFLREAQFVINKAKSELEKRKLSQRASHDVTVITERSSAGPRPASQDTEPSSTENDGRNTSPPPPFTDPLLDMEHDITAALDVISLLCDRQQKKMQDAMRNKGSNIVSQVSFILFYISKHWDDTKVNVAQKTVQALIEMCTGNYNNQDIAYKGQVIVSINVILKALFSNDDEGKRKLKSSCLELLEVMLEEIDENSHALANYIANHLEMENLIRELKKSWESERRARHALRACWRKKPKDTSLVIRAYHVLRRIADYKCLTVNQLVATAKVKGDKKMWQHYQEQSRSVQIIYRGDEKQEILTRVYFPKPDIHIKDKKTIEQDIKRSTPQEKLLDLLKWTKAVKEDNSKKKNKLRKYKLVHNIFLKTETLRHCILVILTFVLNLLILFTVKTPPDYNMPNGVCTVNETYNETCNNSTSSSPMYFQPIWYPDIELWSRVILTILGVIHAVLALMMLTEYFAKNWGHFTFYFTVSHLKFIIKSKLLCFSFDDELEQQHVQSNEYFVIFFESFQPLYRIIFTICSVVAFIPHPTTLRYFYCGCMLYPFIYSDTMLHILKALRKGSVQLFTVLLLCLVITYIYAVVSFALLNNYFSEERDQFCGSLWQCFITVSRLGLLSTLGYELDIRPSDYEPDFTLYVFRTFYDLIFFIVVTTLGLNIIIAILVDIFSEMRGKQEEVEKDKENRCFICSIDKSEFDKQSKDFNTHVKKEHNIWDFIRFIIYVNSLFENEHNALEKYISEKIPSIERQESDKTTETTSENRKFVDFFPIFRAKALPDYKHSESASEETLVQLVKKIEKMEESMKSKDVQGKDGNSTKGSYTLPTIEEHKETDASGEVAS